MQDELSILALYGLLVIVVLLLHVLTALGQFGLSYAVSPRDEKIELTGIAGRVERTLKNSLIALAIFAPAILILGLKDAYTGTTILAAQLFLICRLIYVPLYIMGIPYLRTLVFVAGLLATAWLYVAAL